MAAGADAGCRRQKAIGLYCRLYLLRGLFKKVNKTFIFITRYLPEGGCRVFGENGKSLGFRVALEYVPQNCVFASKMVAETKKIGKKWNFIKKIVAKTKKFGFKWQKGRRNENFGPVTGL